MQTHTFITDTADEAVKQIRSELGMSAVVLSVRKLPRNGLSRLLKQERIEVVAALAEPEPEAPKDPLLELRQEIRGLKQQVAAMHLSETTAVAMPPACARHEVYETKSESSLQRILIQTGLLPLFAEKIVQELPVDLEHTTPLPVQLQKVQEVLRSKWRGKPLQKETGVHVFIGNPGSGKSTVLCKMLAQSSLVEGQPATIYQLDTHLANSSPQPAIFAEIVGAQFERAAPISLEGREGNVFVDLPGVALNDEKGLAALRPLIESFGISEIHLVLNAAYESSHLLEQIRFFSRLGMTGLIVTHLDEESRWGKIWNLVLGTNYSVRFLSSGQNVPGDFVTATTELILGRQFFGK